MRIDTDSKRLDELRKQFNSYDIDMLIHVRDKGYFVAEEKELLQSILDAKVKADA